MKTRVASSCLPGGQAMDLSPAVVPPESWPKHTGVKEREWFHDGTLTGIPSKAPHQGLVKRENTVQVTVLYVFHNKMLRGNQS